MSVLEATKICSKCGIEKQYSLFHANISHKDRLASWCKDCNNFANQRNKIKKRVAVLSFYSDGSLCCACCGETNLEFLTLDHINNNGAKHRAEISSRGGSSTYAWVIKNSFPEGFRVLCWNCNCSFGHYGYCPHEYKS